ncbi:MAG TPA: winged helix-turn-helix transcriptional regulator [Allosphingosinicella sp.]|nr:winged helix-turn-helix transcriptional regulator [Allosphingosinicella sp.]
MIPEDDLRWLVGSRWFVPLLALASREDGVRSAALVGRLGISRSMLSGVLGQLLGNGWLMRNPGHGHPLRPEYVLTEAGCPVAAWCERVMEERQRLGLDHGRLGRWSLPLVARLDRRWAQFSWLEAQLSPISPRSLSLGLKQLLEVGLAERRLEDAFPPKPLYGLTGRGQRLARAMG